MPKARIVVNIVIPRHLLDAIDPEALKEAQPVFDKIGDVVLGKVHAFMESLSIAR